MYLLGECLHAQGHLFDLSYHPCLPELWVLCYTEFTCEWGYWQVFSHVSSLALVQHTVLELSTLTNVQWIHDPQRANLNVSVDLLSIYLVPPTGHSCAYESVCTACNFTISVESPHSHQAYIQQ